MFLRVATVREKYLEKGNFFQVREKSGNFVNGQGNLERTLKVREKSGNLKWLCQVDLENLFILFKGGKRCTFSCDSLSPSPYSLGATLKGKNLLPWGANSFL